MDKNKDIEVSTIQVSDFFNSDRTVALLEYQRPYVWDETKIEQLLNDFEAHFFTDNTFKDRIPYYLGAVLLYKSPEGNYEIIDGQQRISTLLLMDYAWNDGNSYLAQNKWNLSYTSLLSAAKLRTNFNYFKNHVLQQKYKNNLNKIFSGLVFTVIVTKSQDDSFTFFDSQNNRGVSLSAVDFLKSYHLRELKARKELQRIFAKKWDSNNKSQFLNMLFNKVLWRNRSWKGKNLYYEYKDAILNNFQKETIKETNNDVIRLYPNTFNTLADSLEFQATEGVIIKPGALNIQTKAEQYPFAIRQPIQRGVGFFLYTEKYHSIYHILFKEKKIEEFIILYETLYNGVSPYLKSFFKLATVAYYDKFKAYRLVRFGLWLDYLLGSYRVNQHTIVRQTIIKILRDQRQNLLDVIEMAYRPEDVFIFLKSITNNDAYKKTVEELGSDNGVRNRYRKNNLTFFKKEESQCLDNKLSWIEEYGTK